MILQDFKKKWFTSFNTHRQNNVMHKETEIRIVIPIHPTMYTWEKSVKIHFQNTEQV